MCTIVNCIEESTGKQSENLTNEQENKGGVRCFIFIISVQINTSFESTLPEKVMSLSA